MHGKVEFEASEEGREAEVLEHLLRRSVADTFRARLGGVDLGPLVDMFAEGATVETGELVPATDLLSSLGTVPGLGRLLTALGIGEGAETPGSPPPARVRPRRAVPAPPAGQGDRVRPDRLRIPMSSAIR